jgi:hypothetical protein
VNAARRVLDWHRPLVAFGAAMAVLTVVLAGAWLLDDRAVAGAPLWAKPLKFAVSFVLYAFTLAWMLGRLTRWRRAGRRLGTLIAAAGVIEMVIITGQAARGRRSHFNADTPFDGALFGIMGATVAVLYVATLVVGLLLLATPSGEPAADWAVRLGVLVSLLGMSVGVIMVILQGHAVGVPDGGPGLPLVGWSTTGGDLRIAHFAGMHALQVLPIVAGVLAARGVAAGTALRLVVVAAAAHTGLVVLLTWQALRAQALLSPDAATLAALAALAAATGAGLVLARGTRPLAPQPVAA